MSELQIALDEVKELEKQICAGATLSFANCRTDTYKPGGRKPRYARQRSAQAPWDEKEARGRGPVVFMNQWWSSNQSESLAHALSAPVESVFPALWPLMSQSVARR